jgi:hypothetical protein
MKKILTGCAVALALSTPTPANTPFDEGLAVEILRGETLQAAWQLAQTNPEVANRYVMSAVEQGLAMEAAQMGLAERADVQGALQRARRNILVQAMRENHARGIAAPSDAEVKAYYDSRKADFKLPEAYRVTAVQFTDVSAEKADRITTLVKSGKGTTNELVKAEGTLVASGGRDEWIARNNIIPPVWEQLGRIKDGQQTFIHTNRVMVVFTRNAYRPESPASFEEARGSAFQELWNERRNQAWNALITERVRKITGNP